MTHRLLIFLAVLAGLWQSVPAMSLEKMAFNADEEMLTPPAGVHPRLYLRAEDIPDLRRRMSSEEGKAILSKMEANGIDRTPEEEAMETDRGYRYYAKMRGLPSRVQLQALDYLVNGEASSARSAITSLLDSLKHTHFGTKQDLSRASGIMIMTGALVYDWCYGQMKDSERREYIDELIRIAGTMECGYPPRGTEPIAGHISEWMLLRDLLSAAVAIYDEYPDMYNQLMDLFNSKYLPPRNYFYRGGNYHQGTSYNKVRFSCDMFCQWILNRMSGGKDYFDRTQANILYDIIYRRRPDGQVLPSGDGNHSRGKTDTYTLPMMLAGSYYSDPYLLHEARLDRNDIDQHCLIFQLLWEDRTTEDKAPDDLPLSRYSGTPFGWMTARTGWGRNSVIAEMKINEQFVGNHQHLDGGSFQVYYKGPLALDAGYYQGKNDGGYNSANNKNYTKRTIAHNSLLVYDPSEVFECYNYGGGERTRTAVNDGGQRMPGKGWATCRSFDQLLSEEYTVGQTLAHGFGPDSVKPQYTLLKGDITAAYSGSKVRDVRRSFVFLNLFDEKVPAALIVFDRIVSNNSAFKKTWLLHSIEEPSIEENSFTVSRTLDGDSGLLRCDVLWPDNAVIEKIGGAGKEMFVGGVNYLGELRSKDEAREYGAWRVEESPLTASEEDIFLNVMQVGDNDCMGIHRVLRIDSPDVVGAEIADRVVTFSRDGNVLGKDFSFSVSKNGCKLIHLLVTDLTHGHWTVERNGKKIASDLVPDPESHSIYFAGKPGEYTFRLQPFDSLLDNAVKTASEQLKLQASVFDTLEYYPRSAVGSSYEKVKHSDWTCGFFPGSLWICQSLTDNKELRRAAEKFTARLGDIVATPGTHDLGFMVGCSFGREYEYTSSPEAKAAILTAAEALSKRFDERIGLIRSWDFGKWNYPVIIDNMMNLELLFKASEISGNRKFFEIAISHADKTMENHFREDGSSYHVVSYNDDGSVESKGTHQGYSDESTWVRGEAWALYGYLVCYRYTKDSKYLDFAKKIASYIMDNPATPKDRIPYWDYDAPGVPGTTAPVSDSTGLICGKNGQMTPARDASAAAITASALIEMSGVTDGRWSRRCLNEAKEILRSLSSPEYLSEPGSNMGFILKHCTGAAPFGREVDVPLDYADYYFLEAIDRYRRR